MYAIFEKNNNLINVRPEKDTELKSLEIGVDIFWKTIVRRGGKIIDIKKDELKEDDKIILNIYKIESYEITRDKKRLKILPEMLEEKDKIEEINYMAKNKMNVEGYRVCRGGKDIEINVNDMQAGDIITCEYEHERIYTNDKNEFLLKTDSELVDEYKIKIIDLIKGKMPYKYIVENKTQEIIDKIQLEIGNINTLEDIKVYRKSLIIKILNKKEL